MKATVCTSLNLDCSVCKRRARVLVESRKHSMQWPEDILAKVWELVRMGMWRAKMKERLWEDIHDEMKDYWQIWHEWHTLTALNGYPRPIMTAFHAHRFNAYKRLFENERVYVVVSNDEDWEFNSPDIDYAGEYLPTLTFGADADDIIRLGPVDDMGRTTWYAFNPREWGADIGV